ncbi:hypothetical protein PARPLA_01194 [Rhodobacteraceae bacterium THAF1]|uniref:hypothetical protein n=1 Tax=Palleronia sp. THAF1 TaxID=2587842 RepID=UPI000F3C4C38|nr:hypothetical protein [Palleronia sp. THAF1]QFU07283.1 hypothetical protein FIU81_01210 [Palleronia sp. THAF1]VDC20805.1 hypothetical protein PARPLA_01194 [Rhodobacteraceae bacterium THAF1]
MTDATPTAVNGKSAPDPSELHTKSIYLHGLLSVLNNFDPHDLATRNGQAALMYVAEQMADELSCGLEVVLDV